MDASAHPPIAPPSGRGRRMASLGRAALVLGSAIAVFFPASALGRRGGHHDRGGQRVRRLQRQRRPGHLRVPEGAGRSGLHRRRPLHRRLLHPHGAQGELRRHDQRAGGHRHGRLLRRRRRGHLRAAQPARRRRHGRRGQRLHRRLPELARTPSNSARHHQYLRRHGNLRPLGRWWRRHGGAAGQSRRPGARLGGQPVCGRLRYPRRSPDHTGRNHLNGRRQRVRRLLGGWRAGHQRAPQ